MYKQMRTLEQDAQLTTDLHLNHRKLIERGFRPENFEDTILGHWTETVKPEQVVYCLGDVCMGKEGEAHERIKSLPGYKILIRGNHDKQKETWYLSHGWNEVHESLKLVTTVNGRHTRLLLSHAPVADDNSFDINLHGHFHDDLHRAKTPEMQAILTTKHRLVALELLDYRLVSLVSFLNAGTNHIHNLIDRPKM